MEKIVMCEMHDGRHCPEEEESLIDNLPRHALPVTGFICCDSRYINCPYCLEVNVETKKVKFHQKICLYSVKK